MSKIFITVLNMSLTASYVIIAVIIIRLLLKKSPKAISYGLWSVVAFRLICPVSFESVFSLLPKTTRPIAQNIVYDQVPQISSGISNVDQFINNQLPIARPTASVNPIQIYIGIGAVIWIIGIIATLMYSIMSVAVLKRRLKQAKWLEDNIYEAANLKTPFVLGAIRPKIYLPIGLGQDERQYILQHEQTHIKRHDHIIKLLAFFVLALHWFNPLVWLSFRLMSRDMELSCDEKVLRDMDSNMKKPYANSLLSLARGKPILNGSPLAFGEGNVKGRIKNVLSYKKPPFWLIVVAIMIVGGASVALLTNPKTDKNVQEEIIDESIQDSVAIVETKGNTIKPITPTWDLDQTTGADMAKLDYASDDIIIFHGYFGLYVYDLEKREIIRSLDLKAIGCDKTQGDDYCEVSVSKDGNTVQLHPVSSDHMYVYTVSDHSLKKTAYEAMEESFRENFPFKEGVRSKIDYSMGMHVYTYNVVELEGDERGYLYSTKDTLGTLYYRGSSRLYNLFGDDTVIPVLKSASPTSIVMTYENPTDKEVLYGDSHLLERWSGTEWINIPLKPGVAWRDIQNKLPPNHFKEESINTIRMHGILDKGHYRLIKSIEIDSSPRDVIMEFEISEDAIIVDSEDFEIE